MPTSETQKVTTKITGDIVSDYNTALAGTKKENFNSRGFIPFQFSSRRHQMEVSEGNGIFGMRLPNIPGMTSDITGKTSIASDKKAWYEMWIS